MNTERRKIDPRQFSFTRLPCGFTFVVSRLYPHNTFMVSVRWRPFFIGVRWGQPTDYGSSLLLPSRSPYRWKIGREYSGRS